MALKVWLPLTGTLENKGISNIAISNNGPTIADNGKIGKCYYFDNKAITLTSPLVDNSAFSVCGWMKLDEGYQTNYGFHLFAIGNNFRCCLSKDNSLFRIVANGATQLGTVEAASTITTDTWYHVVVTYGDGTYKIYLNGVLNSQKTLSAPNIINQNAVIGTYTTEKCKGWLNDFRLYDHCLSAKEVKEISQGLVLHYKLDGFSGGAGENLAIGTNTASISTNVFNQSNQTGGISKEIVYDNGIPCVKITRNDTAQSGWKFFSYNNFLRNNIKTSTQYTVSFDIKASVNGTIGFTGLVQGNATNYMTKSTSVEQGTVTQNIWSHIILHCITKDSFSDIMIGSQVIYMSPSASLVDIGVSYLLKNMKLEEGENATSWTPATSEMGIDTTKIIDSSGYGNDGIQNNIVILQDSSRYNYSAAFNGSNSYIKILDNNWLIQGMETITINFWAKATTWPINGGRLISCTQTGGFNLEGGNSGYWRFSIHVYTNAEKTSTAYKFDSNEIQISTLTPNDWNMITLVYDTTGTKTYVNGQLHHTYVNTSYGIHFNTSARLFLGCEANTANPTSPYFNGQMSDFRIYATTLSAEDIADLYHTPVNIDDLQNAHMFEAIEDDNIKIEKNGVFRNKWSEGLELKKLSDGSIWAKLYYYDYDEESVAWTPKDAKWCNKKGKYSCLGDLEKFIPKSGWYEFWYTEDRTGAKYIRWKQSYNPLSRITSSASGTSSEYQFISGTTSNNFYGLTRYNSNDSSYCYLRGYPSWWGAIAPYQTSYDVFPGLWGTSTNNYYQELWINITENENISRLTANSQSLYIIEK